MTDSNIVLSVEDLKVYFRSDSGVARAVDGVSYQVRRGQTVCLVGESGCGKTVSSLAILGLIAMPPGEIVGGSVRFNGMDILALSDEQLRKIRGKRIAMVFQEPMTSLNPVFTIGDQIAEAILVHDSKVSKIDIESRCVKLLSDVGISSPQERLMDYPHQLSGGQRQRVMIAMALACTPQLIIADEPTTALDVTIQAQILRVFKDLQTKHHLSLLYITHDLGVVAGIADFIYVMYAGVIVEHGRPNAIFYDSRHPYTQGLLSSLPGRSKRGARLHSIPGTVPDPMHKPLGCPFHPRCSFAISKCRALFPPMCDFGDGHASRCPVLFEQEEKNSYGVIL